MNLASRMESTSESMKIQCTDTTKDCLENAPSYKFNLENRGAIKIKGKGTVDTWWIEGSTARIEEATNEGAGTLTA